MERWLYPLGALGLGFAYLLATSLYERRRSRLGKPHSWLSYFLGWPLILEIDRDKRGGRFLTNRELLGWGLVFLIAVLAIWLTPARS
jgi:hypothetical protein